MKYSGMFYSAASPSSSEFMLRLKDQLIKISFQEYVNGLSDVRVPLDTEHPNVISRHSEDFSRGLVHRRGNYLYFMTLGSFRAKITYHKLDLTDIQVIIEVFKMKLKDSLPTNFRRLL